MIGSGELSKRSSSRQAFLAFPVAGGVASVVLGVFGEPASAQTSASVDVIANAADAFGEKVGDEQIGLYNESQVRGFSLQSAGNYRIEGHYFVRAAALTDDVLLGSSVQIGTSALQADFAAPGGVVAFRLRRAGEGTQGYVLSTGLRTNVSPFVQANGWHATEDGDLSMVWGIDFSPALTYGDGTTGFQHSIGVVPRWRTGGLTVTGLVSALKRASNGGGFGFVSTTDKLPPKVAGSKFYGAPWALHDTTSQNVGIAADLATGQWTVRASSYLSNQDEPTDDFTLLEVDENSIARATASKSRDQWSRSFSNEIGASRDISIGDSSLRLYGMARYRSTVSRSTRGDSFDLGYIDLEDIEYPADPEVTGDAPYSRTTIDQTSLGVGSEVRLGNVLRARASVQRVWHDKTVTSGDVTNETATSPWLYDAALTVPVASGWLIYGTYTRGLEEKGVAPGNAVNRNEVLPTVQVTQIEAGIRGRLTSDLTLISALFQISKPNTGFDDSGRFGIVGDIRHRGFEISLSGRVTDRLSISGGVVAFDPKITSSADAVNPPVVSVGTQPITASVSASYDIPGVPGLSLDGRLTYNDRRPARADGAFYSPERLITDVGGRFRTTIGTVPTVFRARVQNLTNNNSWTAQSSGLLRPQGGRSFTLTAEMAF